jgi:hypothetical protein
LCRDVDQTLLRIFQRRLSKTKFQKMAEALKAAAPLPRQ